MLNLQWLHKSFPDLEYDKPQFEQTIKSAIHTTSNNVINTVKKMSLESKKRTKEHPEKVITILDKSCIV